MDRSQSRGPTIGVEEEFQLLCPDTLALVPRFDDLAACWHAADAGDRAASRPAGRGPGDPSGLAFQVAPKSELHQSCCEVVTRPCATVSDLESELRSNRQRLAAAAEQAGMAIGLSGTHPFSLWYELPITREPRRLQSEYQFQEAHRQCLAFALHIHIGIPDRQTGLRAMNDARALLPILYALSCSSPFLEGRRTGLKSSRLLRAFSFPRTGIPDALESLAELEAQIASMCNTGLIVDAGQLWWDIRLHHVYPTIEFRVADAVPRLRDVTALAALTQAFVAYLLHVYQRGIRFETIDRWILCENRWRAARFGVESELIATPPLPHAQPAGQQECGPDAPAPQPSRTTALTLQSIPSIVADLCELLRPVAARLGTASHLERCEKIAQTGSAADRQLALIGADNSDLRNVVSQYCQETSTA